jgi:hypothetical protein
MRLSIKLYNHFNFHKASITYYLIGLIVLFFLNFNKSAILIFGIWWAIDLIPAIILHIEYWLKNKDEQYEIKSNEIIKYKGDEIEIFKVDDFEKIVEYKSASVDKGGIPFLCVESYYYFRIFLKSGDEIILTRLLSPTLEQEILKIKGVKRERKKRLLNTLSWK